MAQMGAYSIVQDYCIDAAQRSVLFLDILRERGNIYLEHKADELPNVLTFKSELVIDGRTLPRPANYVLLHIKPSDGAAIDPRKTPFIVVDPRAGHGPGIGGMKADSEIGVALAAGHPCYFVAFFPEPVPGQTIEDVCVAEAAFVKAVAARHPHAEGKPVIIANCQAGWQVMMMAATHPRLAGPIMLCGSPLSYWAGVRGKNPLRYTGGVLGGTWATALSGDLGDGIFDGAHLVANFERLNPANTLWTKPYNVFSKADTEGARFLDFETWWGSPILLTAEEMQWIADNLFVGNKLSSGRLRTSDGLRIDLRNIRSPIIVFCSWGDDITPPQQALDWITDLYDHEGEIAANGQTIVYSLHQSIGHLGIFVSGKVATKEHREFVSCMEMIDLMPPGLYEAVITGVDESTESRELVEGGYVFTLKARTLNDIRALGQNSPADDLRFATAARVSAANTQLYRKIAQPLVRAVATKPMAEVLRWAHPNRLRFAAFSDKNPAMQSVCAMAETARRHRKPVARDNPLLAMEEMFSSWITAMLDGYGVIRDAMTEAVFLNTYGSPLLQAMVGLSEDEAPSRHHAKKDLMREALEAHRRSELEHCFESGTPLDAVLRGLFYVARGDERVDERTFAKMKALRDAQPENARLPIQDLKSSLADQSAIVRLDEERAIEAIPALLPDDDALRRAYLAALQSIVEVRKLSDASKSRFERIETLFGGGSKPRIESIHA